MKKHIFTKFGLRLVKETSGIYNVSNKVTSAIDVANICYNVLRTHEFVNEKFHVFFLNTKNVVTGFTEISSGTLNASLVHPREVFKAAILNNCNSIIVTHNHPSGDVTPSQADIQVTDILKKAGKLLNIEVLDHIITGDEDTYYSMRENGTI